MLIRDFVDRDWSQVWPIIEEVIRAQETFPYDPALTAEQSYGMWVEAAPARTVVAVDGERVLGTAKMGANRPGPGARVSTASFMVAADARGRGVGTALCRDVPGRAQRRQAEHRADGALGAAEVVCDVVDQHVDEAVGEEDEGRQQDGQRQG
ncbi:GNAT family N-acetyltransferase [Micromonospora sp. NPDC050795]|uniref:GNAT family N-acetyltransferase n=1 Tax=Micromonospora sp. NPDC050795 TaxID=3364282 RepID=UPI00378E2547